MLETIQTALWNIRHRLGILDVLDILLVAVIIYEIIMLTRKTRGSAVLKGLVVLLVAVGISNLMGLTALNWLLSAIIKNGVLVLIILFQPELRKALEEIGRGAFLDHSKSNEKYADREHIIDELITCLTDLSKRKVGALIVIEQKTGLQDVIETGTMVDGEISAPLLENIFEPNTPLHDGAVIIRGTRVVSAACILPLTEKRDINRELGTRHRAGIGVSETTDAVVLIVSEETGVISIARAGAISRGLEKNRLKGELRPLFDEQKSYLGTLFGLSHRSKGGAA